MSDIEYRREGYVISTDKTRLDDDLIFDYLSNRSYWARGRSRPIVEKSINHSLCFGVYEGLRQAGFARFVTDYSTAAVRRIQDPRRSASMDGSTDNIVNAAGPG
jgi:hypothetical protein